MLVAAGVHVAAPLRWQQPGASSSGRLWAPDDVFRLCTQPDTRTRAAVRARPGMVHVQAAAGETASPAAPASSTAARQKALDAVRESLRKRAASGGGQRAANSKAAPRTAAARTRQQGGKQSSIAQPFQGSAPVTLRRPAVEPAADGQRLSKVWANLSASAVEHMLVIVGWRLGGRTASVKVHVISRWLALRRNMSSDAPGLATNWRVS